jgi:putative salt-induced outer membrane protein YdiY
MIRHIKNGIFASESRPCLTFLSFIAATISFACSVLAQAPADRAAISEPDILIFANGDRLTGQLERSDGKSVIFKADMAGEITVEWKKIQEIHTNREFAVIPKGVNVKRGESPAKIPQGTFAVNNQQIQLRNPGIALQTIPTADSAYVVDKKTFDNAVRNGESPFQGWNGSITLGASLVEATQKSNTLSGAASLLRVTPQEHWLDRRDRTSLNVSFAYGKLTQPDTPDVKTDIYHLDAEQDRYFTSRLFGFGVVAFDHNFSQGLDLQQSYGAGIGWTVVKTPNNELNLRSSLNYLKEQFQVSDQNQNLIGSTFTENYTHTFAHNIVLTEQGSATPAWNNTNAYSAAGQIGLIIPVYKRFSLSLTSMDTFINNPPAGFKKNSMQFTTGLTYSVK